MKHLLAILLIVTAAPAYAQTLENSHVRLDFNPANYALIGLTDKDNSFSLSFYTQTMLWRLIILDISASPPNIDWDDHFDELWATSVAGSRSYSLETVGSEQVLHLDWTDFALPNGGQATVNVEIHLPDDSSESIWIIAVSTSGAGDALWRVDFPIFMMDAIDGDPENDIATIPIHSGLLVRNPHANSVSSPGGSEIRPDANLPGNHPGSWEMQWMHVYDETSLHGIFLRSTDSAGYTKGLSMTPYYSRATMLWRNYPENNNTADRTYAPTYDVRLLPMVGDWFDAAKVYRSWLVGQSWCAGGPLTVRSDFPRSTAESISAVLFSESTPFSTGEEYLQSHLAWRDFLNIGTLSTHLRGAMNALPEPIPSQGLIDGLELLHGWGIRSVPYTNTHGWDRSTSDDAAGTLDHAAARTINGDWIYTPVFDNWKMCCADAMWQQKYVDITEALVDAGTTDQYCDLYPSTRLCFGSSHGHPLGGGHWWIDGYRAQIQAARTAARAVQPDFIMAPEHRSETTLDIYDAYPVNYWTYQDDVFRGGVETGIPTPIVAAVMHDYVAGIAATQVPYNMIGSNHFRFAHGWSLVHGNIPTVYHDPAPGLVTYPSWKQRHFDYMRTLIYHRHEALKFLLYGEYLRPPDTDSGMQDVIMYGEPFEQPVVLGGAFRADDGTLGIFMTNYNTSARTANFRIARDDYALGSGTYEIYSISPAERLFYGGFRGTDYVRKWVFDGGDILMLEIVSATDTDGDGMSDDWETGHGLNPGDPSDATVDGDGDGLTNLQEFQNGTDPSSADTDGDEDTDPGEIAYGSDPRDPTSNSTAYLPALSAPLLGLLCLALASTGLMNRAKTADRPPT